MAARALETAPREAASGRLDGRVALVTGASRGIGAAVARALSGQGVRLGLASRTGDDLGLPETVARPCDVRDPASVEALVRQTVERFGGLDIVVANAGVGSYGPFLELPADQLEEIIDVNVKGTVHTLRAALPHLLESDAADVVTIASEAGRRGLPFEAAYCASKFAQVGLTRSLDHELRPHGVRCTNVCPGGVATDFAMGRGRTPDMPELAGMMSAEDVAEAVLFVLTRPRNHRVLEMAFRPLSEASWG
jgi:3-oxoacyl-[acyl-carrier protein] reductase